MKFVFFHHHGVKARYSLVDDGGGAQLPLHPVHFLFIAEIFDKLLIVRIIVLLFKRGKLVETFNKQSLSFEIGKAERSRYFIHSLLFCPVLDGGEQCVCHRLIVYAVETGKANALLIPLFVRGKL